MATSKYITLPNGKRVKRQTAAANHPSGKSTKSTTKSKGNSNKKKTSGSSKKKTTTSSPNRGKKVTVKKPGAAPVYTMPEAYKSALDEQINSALGDVTNIKDFSYDPLQDASYQALAKIYNQQGAQAARDTLGDMAALNGGLGSSAATSAAAQQRSSYNQQLAAQIPDLRNQAYNEYLNNYNMRVTALDALMGRDDSLYGRYRDTVGDQQFKFSTKYDTWRDKTADYQWGKGFNFDVDQYRRSIYENNRDFGYQKKRDKITDSQWRSEYNLKKNSLSSSKKKKSKSSGGSRRSGGGYYSSSGGVSGSSSNKSLFAGAKAASNARRVGYTIGKMFGK